MEGQSGRFRLNEARVWGRLRRQTRRDACVMRQETMAWTWSGWARDGRRLSSESGRT